MMTISNKNEYEAHRSKFWSAKAVLARQRQEPVYLTNQCCESTLDHADGKEVFATLGLEYGLFADQFYPLTDRELKFVGEDCVHTKAGIAMTGYSVLYQGRKYLSPCIEFPYVTEGTDPYDAEHLYPSEDAARDEVNNLCVYLDRTIRGGGGFAWASYEDGPDGDKRHTVAVLLPVHRSAHYSDLDAWKKYIKSILAHYKPLRG
jgi:hypothetical protein